MLIYRGDPTPITDQNSSADKDDEDANNDGSAETPDETEDLNDKDGTEIVDEGEVDMKDDDLDNKEGCADFDVANTVSFEKIVKMLLISDADDNGRISADEFGQFMNMITKVQGGDILVNSIECTAAVTDD